MNLANRLKERNLEVFFKGSKKPIKVKNLEDNQTYNLSYMNEDGNVIYIGHGIHKSMLAPLISTCINEKFQTLVEVYDRKKILEKHKEDYTD